VRTWKESLGGFHTWYHATVTSHLPSSKVHVRTTMECSSFVLLSVHYMYHPGGNTEMPVTSWWHRIKCKILLGIPSQFLKRYKTIPETERLGIRFKVAWNEQLANVGWRGLEAASMYSLMCVVPAAYWEGQPPMR